MVPSRASYMLQYVSRALASCEINLLAKTPRNPQWLNSVPLSSSNSYSYTLGSPVHVHCRFLAFHALQPEKKVEVLSQISKSLAEKAGSANMMSYGDVLTVIKSSDTTLNDTEANALFNDMQKSGHLLRFNDSVYLKPDEITNLLVEILPVDDDDAKLKLDKIEKELSDMDKQHAQLEKIANRSANRLLMTGFFILTAQFLIFIWLTWFELSWDVMEPFSYCISLFYTLIGVMYFIITKGDLWDLPSFKEYWALRAKAQVMRQLQFNEARHRTLISLRDRYQRHLAAVARRI